MPSVKGIAQYNHTVGFIDNATTTAANVPGLSFEMQPGKSYQVFCQFRLVWKQNAGYQLNWANVVNSINSTLNFTLITESPSTVLRSNTGELQQQTPGTNAAGVATYMGIIKNGSNTAKQTAQLTFRMFNAAGGELVEITNGTIQAVQID